MQFKVTLQNQMTDKITEVEVQTNNYDSPSVAEHMARGQMKLPTAWDVLKCVRSDGRDGLLTTKNRRDIKTKMVRWDERRMSKLPRAKCPKCGKVVALRVLGELREHQDDNSTSKLCVAAGMLVPEANVLFGPEEGH